MCIFCQIINKELPSTIVYEDEEVVAFNDINPSAETHVLIVPKKHIDSIKELEETDEKLAGHLLFVAKKIAEEKGLKGYKLQFNVGKEGGQIIFHLHLHLLGGKNIKSV